MEERRKEAKKKLLIVIIACVCLLIGIGIISVTLYEYNQKEQLRAELNSAFDELVGYNQDTDDGNGVQISDKDAFMNQYSIGVGNGVDMDGRRNKIAEENRYYNDMLMVAKLEIPKIDVDDIVVEGTGNVFISTTLGHFSETQQPGEVGNFAIAGHRGGKYGTFFKYLPELEIGDEIKVTNIYGDVFIYTVTDSYVVKPDEFWILEPSRDGVREITLMTCTENGTKRYVVRGEIKN
ncbi:MAG: class D sortase [Clostridia bacterium]|nr:class D sortase [Clostridia bacterium]